MTAATDQTVSPHAGSPAQWVRANLFRSWWDGLVTVVLGGAAAWGALALGRFLIGADYSILRANLTLFMLGRFPRDQLWRPALALVMMAGLAGTLAGLAHASARAAAAESGQPFRPATPSQVLRRAWPLLVVVAMVLALTQTVLPTLVTLAAGGAAWGSFLAARRAPAAIRRWWWAVLLLALAGIYLVLAGFGGVAWHNWGGLHLNLFLTVAGIIFAFPLGLLLALGRRSSLPALRWASVTYIELIRGVPLIALLLMGIFAIGFFLPIDVRPEGATRVLIAITLFEAAYIAEVVRGGLQAVPRGQVEASQALGLSPWKTMRLVVLPQALRATIPAMVGQFISLYKDTTLVSIVGLLDVLTVSTVANSQPDFLAQGFEVVSLPFVGLLFWVGCYAMSREARRLERRVGLGER